MSRTCLCRTYRSVTRIAEENGLWLVPPIRYLGGWETHRVITDAKAALDRFVKGVQEVGRLEVLSLQPRERLGIVRDFGFAPHLFAGLTERQVEIVVSAYEAGLLEIPARTQIGQVARRHGLSRSTYGEHLRKAQLRILRNSYPYLKLRGDDDGGRKTPKRKTRR